MKMDELKVWLENCEKIAKRNYDNEYTTGNYTSYWESKMKTYKEVLEKICQMEDSKEFDEWYKSLNFFNNDGKEDHRKTWNAAIKFRKEGE